MTEGAGRHALKKLEGLTIAVPAYNEEATLEPVVRECLAVAPAVAAAFEVLIIDDASRDRTPALAESLAGLPGVRVVHHQENRGFGGSQETAFREAAQPFIVLVPGDGQFPPADIPLLVRAAPQADIVLGYRTERKDPLQRRIQTRALSFVARRLLGLPFRDVNWVKLYRTKLVRGLSIESRRIGVDCEVLLKAKARGARFSEAMVSYLPRSGGSAASLRLPTVLKTAGELFGLWLRLKRGTLRA
ncbi:MAG: glycosyltransferase family 2 protein [Elusimicrobia bacterium]|nr:glycosyltransferase family 2 protein [Elusimicrobiota bacterium]